MRRRKLEGKLLQWDSLGRGICGRGKDPEHVRELVGGMWAPFEEELRPLSAPGISLQEWSLTYLQGMAIDTLSCKECEVTNWLQKNACYSLLAAGVAPPCH